MSFELRIWSAILHDAQREQAKLVAGRRAGQLFPPGTRELVLYPPEQVNMFGRIAQDLDRANRSVTSTAIKGSPGTAKEALPFLKRSVQEAKNHASILGAAMAGSILAFESAGLTGAVTGAGLGGGAYLLGSLRAAGIRKAEDMFRDALLNPERAKYYLSQVPPKLDGGAGYTLSRVIRHELMMAPVLTPSHREDVSKRKAELVHKSPSRPSVLAPAQGR